jgi:vacuolar-type H+-ATPase subunit H
MPNVAKQADMSEELETRGNYLIQNCENLFIANDNDLRKADEIITYGAGHKKMIEEFWAPFKKHANALLTEARANEKRMLDPAKTAIDILVQKMGAYKKRQAELNREEARLEAEVAAFDMEEDGHSPVAVKAMQELAEDSRGDKQVAKTKTSIKDDWVVEIIPQEAYKIPIEYLVPINDAMRKAVAANIKKAVKKIEASGKEVKRSLGGNIIIPGVRITPTFRAIKRSN